MGERFKIVAGAEPNAKRIMRSGIVVGLVLQLGIIYLTPR